MLSVTAAPNGLLSFASGCTASVQRQEIFGPSSAPSIALSPELKKGLMKVTYHLGMYMDGTALSTVCGITPVNDFRFSI